MFRISAPILAAMLVCGAVTARAQPAGKPPAGKPGGLPVRVAAVKLASVATEITAVGTLIPNESVVIRPETAGRIVRLQFSEGQPVAKGSVVVSLDAAEVNAQIAATEADVTLNRQRLQRAEDLFQKGFFSSQALDEARSALAKSNAKLQEDRARLARMEIRAPFSGIAGLRQVSEGAYLKAGDDIVRLESINPVKLDFRVPETFLARVRRDQAVSVRVDAHAGEQFAGRVYAIEPVVDDKTRTIALRAIVRNDAMKLRPGMFARVSLVTGSHDNAILVPEEAIVPRGQSNYVFRVVEGKAALVEVVIGSRRAGEVEIVKGLGPADRVVTDGQMKLQDGAAVMVVADKPPAAAPSATAPAPAAKPR